MCTGTDGIRVAWGPLTMPDRLLRAFIVAYRNNFRRDDELEIALDLIAHGGADVLGETAYGIAPGAVADLVLIDGQNDVEAIIERPTNRLVMKRGRVVAQENVCLISLDSTIMP